jgi:hypothetical protein
MLKTVHYVIRQSILVFVLLGSQEKSIKIEYNIYAI